VASKASDEELKTKGEIKELKVEKNKIIK